MMKKWLVTRKIKRMVLRDQDVHIEQLVTKRVSLDLLTEICEKLIGQRIGAGEWDVRLQRISPTHYRPYGHFAGFKITFPAVDPDVVNPFLKRFKQD